MGQWGCVLIALLCMTVKGACGKKTSGYVTALRDSFLFNLLRMLFCVLIGLGLVFAERLQGEMALDGGMLLICIASGAANAAFLVGWLLAVQKNTMVAVDVTLTLGSIIPAVLCALLFGEAMSYQKLIGFALILLASFILSAQKGGTAKEKTLSGVLLLLLAVLGDGLTGFCQQLYRQYYTEGGSLYAGVSYAKSVYHFYTYVFAAIILLLVFLTFVFRSYQGTPREERGSFARKSLQPLVKPLPHIFTMAVCLFAANYFQTVAANDYGMSSQLLYPIIKGGCLITVNITAMLFFGEPITKRSLLGSSVALAGIVVMNLL